MLSRISISPSWLELIVHPTASVRALFFHFFIPTDCSAPGRGQLYLLRARKDPEVPHFKRFLRHLSAPLLPSTCPVKWRRAALQPTAGRRRTFGSERETVKACPFIGFGLEPCCAGALGGQR